MSEVSLLQIPDKYLDARWRDKRDVILRRDEFHCQRCTKRTNLHVHHLIYIKGRDTWSYRSADLVTLCGDCHHSVHELTGAREQVERGNRAVIYPYQMPRQIGDIIAKAIG